MPKRTRRIITFFLNSGIGLLGFIIISNVIVVAISSQKTYDTIANTPTKPVALVLGTSSHTTQGHANRYFSERMETAAKLYKSNKVKKIIVSGDHRSRYYNEPHKMKKTLINHGVPSNIIIIDDAGYNTIESILRLKQVFSFEEVIIVSQKYHNFRAVFMALAQGIDAVAINADAQDSQAGFKQLFREFLARPKAIFDVVIRRKPTFLGKQLTPEETT